MIVFSSLNLVFQSLISFMILYLACACIVSTFSFAFLHVTPSSSFNNLVFCLYSWTFCSRSLSSHIKNSFSAIALPHLSDSYMIFWVNSLLFYELVDITVLNYLIVWSFSCTIALSCMIADSYFCFCSLNNSSFSCTFYLWLSNFSFIYWFLACSSSTLTQSSAISWAYWFSIMSTSHSFSCCTSSCSLDKLSYSDFKYWIFFSLLSRSSSSCSMRDAFSSSSYLTYSLVANTCASSCLTSSLSPRASVCKLMSWVIGRCDSHDSKLSILSRSCCCIYVSGGVGTGGGASSSVCTSISLSSFYMSLIVFEMVTKLSWLSTWATFSMTRSSLITYYTTGGCSLTSDVVDTILVSLFTLLSISLVSRIPISFASLATC